MSFLTIILFIILGLLSGLVICSIGFGGGINISLLIFLFLGALKLMF